MIEAKQLTKNYGTFTAVRDVTFTAEKGEVVGLLGPNGAGKTTTMRMLTGYTPPTRGTAILAGFDVTVDPLDVRENIGYLPERVPIYPDMTVREYVSYWGQLRGLHNRRERLHRVDEVIDTVQLGFKRNKLVRSLSKGMRQRLGLAQALVHNPPIIILDEPTIGIDPQQVLEVRDTVRRLGNDHCVLFSTHILTEAEQVCDRLVIINQG
ncbi:MAG: ABC transporter ATP-binding protein, partial [Chloroflexota bacterium]